MSTLAFALEVPVYLRSWGSQGLADGQFINTSSVAVFGNIVTASDRDGCRMEQFDTSGTFIRKWGSNGIGPGQFA